MIDRTQIAMEARNAIIRVFRKSAEDLADMSAEMRKDGGGYECRLLAAKAAIYEEAADAIERVGGEKP